MILCLLVFGVVVAFVAGVCAGVELAVRECQQEQSDDPEGAMHA